jgi:hypothetical protein
LLIVICLDFLRGLVVVLLLLCFVAIWVVQVVKPALSLSLRRHIIRIGIFLISHSRVWFVSIWANLLLGQRTTSITASAIVLFRWVMILLTRGIAGCTRRLPFNDTIALSKWCKSSSKRFALLLVLSWKRPWAKAPIVALIYALLMVHGQWLWMWYALIQRIPPPSNTPLHTWILTRPLVGRRPKRISFTLGY